MFSRKVAVLVLCFMCAAAVAYAQRSLLLYGQRDLPMPQDPVQDKTMTLTSTEMQLKTQAEGYLKQGNLDSAVETLEGITNQWVSHWFLSYAYESKLLYRKALGEVGWLIHQSQRKDLTIELTERKKGLERAIQEIDEQPASPQQPKKGLIWE
ncbi:MAG: hypothetical protein A2Y65_01735 [Deltaproteobacteria bacterium RBG_13_52_11]|nr:MAG: hypothetical protein A2Y65_01735 [Deltaproteobacteria bacterium RBG_13_52_11]